MSTNGVIVYWYLKKSSSHRKKNANGPPKTVKPIKTAPTPVRQLQKRHYGVHQQDSEVFALRHLNIVAVDPVQTLQTLHNDSLTTVYLVHYIDDNVVEACLTGC